jgi:hypothetical protein
VSTKRKNDIKVQIKSFYGDLIEEKARSGTVEFSSGIYISASFTAECAENAEASENPSVD